MSIKHIFASAVLALVALPSLAHAQKNVVPGTGCPGPATPIRITGAPMTGSTVTFAVTNAAIYRNNPFIRFSIGLPWATPLVLDPPFACVSGCVLAVNPLDPATINVFGSTASITIPAGLVGVELWVQIQAQATPLSCGYFSKVRSLGVVR